MIYFGLGSHNAREENMLFNSLSFLVFFPICIALYLVMPRKARVYLLLAASLYFYMCWNISYVALLLISIIVTYGAGIILGKCERELDKKLTVAASLIINFGILFVFKYFNFFTESISKITHTDLPTVDFLLPVGISFYTFQAVGYMIDVYRGEKPEKNFARYALFVSFFPQLVAGPIERSKNLLARIRRLDNEDLMNREDLIKGVYTMLYGYFLKMIIADRLAIAVDHVFNVSEYSSFNGFQLGLTAIFFSIQIYCDFAGYTYIAIGAARVMGIKICDNFNTPYLSVGIKDFWNRWHMSLTGWFRDYLYFPLGGSKKGKLRKYINILIVFVASGLWHGAAWHFVAWGALHGVLRVLEEMVAPYVRKCADRFKWNIDTFATRVLRIVINFIVVTLLWIFFRAQSTGQALHIIKLIFTSIRPWQFFNDSILAIGLDTKELNVAFIALAFMTLIDVCKKKGRDILSDLYRQNTWFMFLTIFVSIILIVIFGIYGAEYDATQFIYFQF